MPILPRFWGRDSALRCPRTPQRDVPTIAIQAAILMVARRMKVQRVIAHLVLAGAVLSPMTPLFADTERSGRELLQQAVDAPRFEVAIESAYLFGFINSTHSYEIGAEFLTARVRWGAIESDSWLHGYNQFYVLAVAEPVFRGIENHYFGFNTGLRYNFVRPNWRLVPYISGGLGLGWIDSQPGVPGGQGQDFTFNILTAIGASYEINDHWKLNIGVLYEHLSNGGQTNPNPSLNLLGPQIGLNYSF
jgi:lipid A 3-O-deacylase